MALIGDGIGRPGGAWADLGSGSGAFTAALAGLLGAEARLWSVDLDARAIRAQQGEMAERFAGVEFHPIVGDFTGDLPLPRLDGILLANSLHFQEDACEVLAHVAQWLTPAGRLIVVEYDIGMPNPWVPHPVPLSALPRAAECAGLSPPRLLGTHPSRYHRRMYAAVLSSRGSAPARGQSAPVVR